MSKRAVMISFDMWKEMLTKGWRAEWVECTEGLPDDAKLIGTFQRESGGIAMPTLVMVFESQQWGPQESDFAVETPDGESILVFIPEHHIQQAPKEQCYTLEFTDNGERRQVRIHSPGYASITTDFQPELARINHHLLPLPPLPYTFEVWC